ncbi:hypothetical protein Tco_0818333 [Tanacetum coccineum]
MSIFKCPMGVLKLLESIRRNFFNDMANSDRRLALIGWKKVLASKKNGGLGVLSFFALNRALLIKWIWRFISHDPSLWSRLIKAIYRPKGDHDNSYILPRCSPWLNIIREFKSLSFKGIDLFYFVKKVGNSEDTSFWDDIWLTDSPFKLLYLRPFLLELDKQVIIAFKLRDTSLVSSFRRASR